MSEPVVELGCAYIWECPKCSIDHFARAVVMELTPTDIRRMKKEYGGTDADWQTGHWMTRPDEVTCPQCDTTYETEDWVGPKK